MKIVYHVMIEKDCTVLRWRGRFISLRLSG